MSGVLLVTPVKKAAIINPCMWLLFPNSSISAELFPPVLFANHTVCERALALPTHQTEQDSKQMAGPWLSLAISR